MNSQPLELALAALIVVVLVIMAGYFAWRQWQTLRGELADPELAVEDRLYVKFQAWRRLVGCGLMLLLAGLLAGAYVFDFEARAKALANRGQAPASLEAAVQRGVAQQRFINVFSFYWIVTVLVLLSIVGLAAYDIWAIRRFGVRHLRKIQSDRRAMIEEQVAILRSQRNGHH